MTPPKTIYVEFCTDGVPWEVRRGGQGVRERGREFFKYTLVAPKPKKRKARR